MIIWNDEILTRIPQVTDEVKWLPLKILRHSSLRGDQGETLLPS